MFGRRPTRRPRRRLILRLVMLVFAVAVIGFAYLVISRYVQEMERAMSM